MDALKQEIGAFLRLLGAILAAALGVRMLAAAAAFQGGWYWLPKICGSVLVLAGTLAVLLQLFRKVMGSMGSLRINVGPSEGSVPAPTGSARDRRKK